jgi:amino acid adenylation domain-containing protein
MFETTNAASAMPPNGPSQAAALGYWANKLQRFRHGGPTFGHPGPPAGYRPAEYRYERVAKSYDKPGSLPVSLEVIGLAAFCLVLQRYNGGEDALVATEYGIAYCPAGEGTDSTAFLQEVRGELDRCRANGPLNVDVTAAALGLSPKDFVSLFKVGFVRSAQMLDPTLAPELVLALRDHGKRIELEFTFDPAKYPEFLIERMCEHVFTSMTVLRGQQATSLGSVNFLSDAERTQIVLGFNSSVCHRPENATLHGLVERQAAQQPLADAVIYADSVLNYGELNERANRIATRLLQVFQVRPGESVGIMVNRSEQAIIALLGILKSGAAYVPIHTQHPWLVVRSMIENAGVKVLIVDSDSIGAVAAFDGALIVLDVELDALEPVYDNLSLDVRDGNTAYVIHTSGSTGRPKGVMVPHRAIVNTILWRNEFYQLGPQDVNLQMPSLAFDSSVVDIFCVLVAGGTLVIPEEDLRLNPRYLTEIIGKHGVTTMIVTPSHYKLLLADLPHAARNFRCVTLAGEAVTNEMLRAHAENLPGVGLFNEYGPAENAVCTTACVLSETESVSIGVPIPNVQVFVLDEHGRVCPIGVAGEMCLGGVGLATGYCSQPELTAERFIDHPVPEWRPGRVYRTGDRAYWRPDGTLEYVGRIDNQVKIRGVRIEIDEIEGAIARYPEICGAAVICEEDPSGLKYLAAYVASPITVSQAELRNHLRTVLPLYAMPDVFVFMNELPLNLNGKIDRNLLRERRRAAGNMQAGNSSASVLETTLLAIARDVLRRAALGPDDNFFDSGANSLRVMELLGRIRGELQCDLAPTGIYAYPTASALAERLSKQRRRDANEQ